MAWSPDLSWPSARSSRARTTNVCLPPTAASEVAPAALASTFVTSLGGVITFTLLSISHGPVAPNWPTGIALGIGGYTGARLQSRLPDTLIRRIVGTLAIAIAAQYLWTALN